MLLPCGRAMLVPTEMFRFLDQHGSLSNALPREHQGAPLQICRNVHCRAGACSRRNVCQDATQTHSVSNALPRVVINVDPYNYYATFTVGEGLAPPETSVKMPPKRKADLFLRRVRRLPTYRNQSNICHSNAKQMLASVGMVIDHPQDDGRFDNRKQ